MNLAVLWTIALMHGNGLARLRVSTCWHMNGLTHTDMAYGTAARPAAETMLARNRHQKRVQQLIGPRF